MKFDIRRLDEMDPDLVLDEGALEDYQEGLIGEFFASPEGKAHLAAFPDAGFWVAQLIHLGYAYRGATPPGMTVGDIDEIVEELFPRKVSLLSPDDADGAIPELTAFWSYLEREYELPQAAKILEYLRKIEPEFKGIINDPDRFGMAKSIFMQGQAAGFDMTTQEGSDGFIGFYNAALADMAAETPGKPRKTKPAKKRKPGGKKKKKKKKRRR
jgi:hypothetical protein